MNPLSHSSSRTCLCRFFKKWKTSTAIASPNNLMIAMRASKGAWRSRISDCFALALYCIFKDGKCSTGFQYRNEGDPGAVFAARNDKVRVWLILIMFLMGMMTGALPFLGSLIPGKFPIEIRVDFGPAGKPALTRILEVDRKTTPKDAVSLVFPVMSGKVCSSIHDLLEIDGVRPDKAKNFWWILTINGSRSVSPYRTHLKRGDLVEWRYLKEIEKEKSGKERKP